MSCSLPQWLQNFPSLPDEKLRQCIQKHSTSIKNSFCCTQRSSGSASKSPLRNLPTIHNIIRRTGTMCVRFPLRVQQSSYHLYTVRGNFLRGSASEISERERASNWISELLLKAQLSIARLGESGVWILVSWCKPGNSGHICQPSTPDCTVCLGKTVQRKPCGASLTHICEQMAACYDRCNTTGAPFDAITYSAVGKIVHFSLLQWISVLLQINFNLFHCKYPNALLLV